MTVPLIEQKEDPAEAREDARGATVGGCALVAFAAIAAVTLGHLNAAVALALATAAWFAVAVSGYFLAWFR